MNAKQPVHLSGLDAGQPTTKLGIDAVQPTTKLALPEAATSSQPSESSARRAHTSRASHCLHQPDRCGCAGGAGNSC